MNEQLSGLFGMYSEAVIALQDDDIVYYNASAQKMMPNISKLKPRDILPDSALCQDSDSFVGEVDIAGEKMTYSATRLGDLRIFSIISPVGHGGTENTAAFSAMSVEMKDYLTAYRAAASIVLPYVEDTEDKNLKSYVAIMDKCYHNILRLTANMEVLGFGHGGGQNLVRESFDLVKTCLGLLEGSAQLSVGLGINMVFESALDELQIYADMDKLVQMTMNILSNSLTHTPKGGTITLTVTQSGTNAIIKVTDTGGGMPEEVRKTAWSGYSKSKTPTDTKSGAGFGLASVSQIARLHGGNVLFDSREGGGTTIAVSIPIEKKPPTGLETSIEFYKSSGYLPILTGLSTVLDYEQFTQKYTD